MSFTSFVPRKTGRKIIVTAQWHRKVTAWFIAGSWTEFNRQEDYDSYDD